MKLQFLPEDTEHRKQHETNQK